MLGEEIVVNSVEWCMECTQCGHEYRIYGYAAIYDETKVICPECGHIQAEVLKMLSNWEVYNG